jgi:(2Fe-2S) ferredoxin
VVYPERTWYTLPDDDEGLEEILNHLKGGGAAQRYAMVVE